MSGLAIPTDAEILAARGPKAAVDPWRPYAMLVEDEPTASGRPEPVATLFLTNRECPFRCLMCDLWKNTTDAPVPRGAIPAQIDYALERLAPAKQIKLYNSGNFFDPLAIPPDDYPEIARRAARFEKVIVENHPRLCGKRVDEFRRLLPSSCRLEIAMGLETIHPEILPRLNKQMTLDDFSAAAGRLRASGVDLRVFLLLRPPWLGADAKLLEEHDAIEWALRGVEFAWNCGAGIVAVIPTRGGNGLMERLTAAGRFAPPSLAALEETLDRALVAPRGRVVVDLWDAQRLTGCERCRSQRIDRLQRLNLFQRLEPTVRCDCHPAAAGNNQTPSR